MRLTCLVLAALLLNSCGHFQDSSLNAFTLPINKVYAVYAYCLRNNNIPNPKIELHFKTVQFKVKGVKFFKGTELSEFLVSSRNTIVPRRTVEACRRFTLVKGNLTPEELKSFKIQYSGRIDFSAQSVRQKTNEPSSVYRFAISYKIKKKGDLLILVPKKP